MRWLSWDRPSWISRVQLPEGRSPQQWVVMKSHRLKPSGESSLGLRSKAQVKAGVSEEVLNKSRSSSSSWAFCVRRHIYEISTGI